MKNTVTEETSYADLNTLVVNNIKDNFTPRKMHTYTYVLGQSLKTSLFDILSNNDNIVAFLSPKFTNFRRLHLVRSYALDSVHVALAIEDKQSWILKNQHQTLLYTFSTSTTAYNLADLLVFYGGKTCIIGCNPNSYIHDRCAIVCFESEAFRLAAFDSTLVFKDVNLHWAGLFLTYCAQYKQLGHISVDCGRHMVTSQNWAYLTNIYKKK
ncbi:hypothetical protein G9A89_018045 [Geosiphon pyriformis]|nr:hypothetical protein G9A89_018045 [Geosiphon pyriformis]